MQEMIEPDRTILIVSVIGLIVIWGSVAYHKYVQDSAPAVDETPEGDVGAGESETAVVTGTTAATASSPQSGRGNRKRKKGGKGR